jgi:hypothetical protein
MLTVSWSDLAGLVMFNIVVACAAVIVPVDRPNDRASWPIPEAFEIWGEVNPLQ